MQPLKGAVSQAYYRQPLKRGSFIVSFHRLLHLQSAGFYCFFPPAPRSIKSTATVSTIPMGRQMIQFRRKPEIT